MKTILVATDFSEVSINAIHYAAELAVKAKAKLILLHVYHIPVVTAEAAIMLPPVDEMEKDSIEGLRKIEQRLVSAHHKNLHVQCVCKIGFAGDMINNFASEHHVDLIVMGTQGVSYITERIIGSTATSVLRNMQCPVLVIDKHIKFKDTEKMVWACDYNETEDKKALRILKEIVELFKARVHILNVFGEAELQPSMRKVVSDFMKLEHTLAETHHSFRYLNKEDVVEGINQFVSKNDMDLVVMIPRKHSILKNIFKESNTKKMLFHSQVPLLALH